MENNKIKDIFKQKIKFEFALEDLFALHVDYEEYGDIEYAYIEELKNEVRSQTIRTISKHILNELESDIKTIKSEIREEVSNYRKNGEAIIKKEAKKELIFEISDLKKSITHELIKELTAKISKDWDIKRRKDAIEDEILAKLKGEIDV